MNNLPTNPVMYGSMRAELRPNGDIEVFAQSGTYKRRHTRIVLRPNMLKELAKAYLPEASPAPCLCPYCGQPHGSNAHGKQPDEPKAQWQPIETAPKDKTVLAYNSLTGIYQTRFLNGQWPMHGWNGTGGTWYPSPTHWMPMPANPKLETKEASHE